MLDPEKLAGSCVQHRPNLSGTFRPVKAGAGFTYPIRFLDPWSLLVGDRFVHISNAHIYERNPGWQFSGIVIGVRKAL